MWTLHLAARIGGRSGLAAERNPTAALPPGEMFGALIWVWGLTSLLGFRVCKVFWGLGFRALPYMPETRL